jgi:hypothetical protein
MLSFSPSPNKISVTHDFASTVTQTFGYKLKSCLVWFDALSHEEFEYVFGFDFRPRFSEIVLQTLKITGFSTKNIFRDFGFSVANSILDIVSSENMFLKIFLIKMLRIESSTNTESLMETENHFCRTCGFRFTEVP